MVTFETYEPILTITTPFAAAHFNVSVFAQIDKNFTGIFEQDRIAQSFVQEPTGLFLTFFNHTLTLFNGIDNKIVI